MNQLPFVRASANPVNFQASGSALDRCSRSLPVMPESWNWHQMACQGFGVDKSLVNDDMFTRFHGLERRFAARCALEVQKKRWLTISPTQKRCSLDTFAEKPFHHPDTNGPSKTRVRCKTWTQSQHKGVSYCFPTRNSQVSSFRSSET